MMWDNDCGALPVVDERDRAVRMITDRDIAIAAATKGRLASEIPVGEVMTGQMSACAPYDDIQSALETALIIVSAMGPRSEGQMSS